MIINRRKFGYRSVLFFALLLAATLEPHIARAANTTNTTSTMTKTTVLNVPNTANATSTMTKTIVPSSVNITSTTTNTTSTTKTNGNDVVGSRPGISLGGGALYTSPRGAQQGTLYGEAQLRLHMTSVFALEGLAGYEQNKFSGTTVNVFPVQASLLIYLLPGRRVSPYILGGGGWYYTQVQGQSGAQNRFGPHAGAGLQVFLNHCWSIDSSWRYIWNENINSQNATHPLGQNFTAGGFMLTAAVNYHF